MQNGASNRWSVASDGVGLLTLGVQLYLLFSWLLPDRGSRVTWSGLAFVVLAALALYTWHKDPPLKYPCEPGEWAAAIVASVLMGAVSFGIDTVVGLINNPKLSPTEAGTKVGGPFGFPLTLMLCPGLTMVAIAGLLRAFLLPSRKA